MKTALRLFILVVACIATVAIAAPMHEEKMKETKMKETVPKTSNEKGDEVVYIQRRESNNRAIAAGSPCNSTRTNTSYPVAHIVGRLDTWNIVIDFHYETHWNCRTKNAFVEGGMSFNQTDKKLYVPECGYYYITSQVQFGHDDGDQADGVQPRPAYTRHQLIVKPNCPSGNSNIRTSGYAVQGADNGWVTTTQTGRLLKMCAGGTIEVKIPTQGKVACCPYGTTDSTFFTAHLVRSTDC